MKRKDIKQSKAHVKPFTVRLQTKEIRDAYEKYCDDNHRSMDGQTNLLIINALEEYGYSVKKTKPKISESILEKEEDTNM